MPNKQGNWDQLKHYILVDTTIEEIDAPFIDYVNSLGKNLDAAAALNLPRLQLTNRTYIGGHFPLRDVGKGKVGFILALHDITDQLNRLNRFMYILSTCLLGVGGILGFLFRTFLRRVEATLIATQANLTHSIRVQETTEQSLIENHDATGKACQDLQDAIKQTADMT